MWRTSLLPDMIVGGFLSFHGVLVEPRDMSIRKARQKRVGE